MPRIGRAAPSRTVNGHDKWRAWARRRIDLQEMAGIDDMLKEVDRRVDELHRRSEAVLAAEEDRR
jgi:hypothetical protein